MAQNFKTVNSNIIIKLQQSSIQQAQKKKKVKKNRKEKRTYGRLTLNNMRISPELSPKRIQQSSMQNPDLPEK